MNHPHAVVPPEIVAGWRAAGLYTDETLADAAADAASRWPDARFVVASAARPADITLRDFHALARRVAGGLRALGIRAGDPVAVQLPNWLEALVAPAALAMLGAPIVPIVHAFGASEVGFILRQCGAKAIITHGRWNGADRAEAAAQARASLPPLHHVVVGETGCAGTIDWDTLARSAPIEAPATVSASDLALILYTSGTTAAPKGACHDHRSLLAEVRSLIDPQRRVVLSPWPAGHIGGAVIMMRFWCGGNPMITLDQWNASEAARLIARYRVYATSGTPLHLGGILDAAESEHLDLSSLKDFGAGATTVTPALIERCEKMGFTTYRAYGLTEHPTISWGNPTDPLHLRLNTDGPICRGVEVRIVDDEGRDVPIGTDGEILSRGPDRFLGYFDPALDDAAFVEGGWLRTGDIGHLDGKGNIKITDRKKDVIIRGGETLSSREIEDHLCSELRVREAAVVGMKDERYGERICAFVRLAAPGTFTVEDAAAHFRARGVAKHKTPEKVVVVDDFPRTPAGKIRKEQLRASLR